MTTSLREQKKQQTRQAISDRATELFLERGFEHVTIAEIASAAQVAKMTVTNYFPRKEDLALDHADAFIRGLADTVAGRQAGESALAALRRAFRDGVKRQDPVIGFAGPEFTRMITTSPTLIARMRELHEQREQKLAETLAEETGASDGDIRPEVAATLLGAVHRVLFSQIVRRTLAGEGNARIAKALARDVRVAFDQLEPALGDYAVRS